MNKIFYDPLKILNEEDEEAYIDITDLFEKKDDNLFHIGQSYEDKVASTVYCKNCGGNEFNVGTGSYFTAIKCTKCQWEICFHDG